MCRDGPRGAPALLLIHGTAASLRSWEPMFPLLAESHRVIRIDLRGCGKSARPDGASYAVPDQACRAGAALNRLGVSRAVVMSLVIPAAEQSPPVSPGRLHRERDRQRADAAVGSDRRAAPPAPEAAFSPGYTIPQPFVDEARGMNLRVHAATSQAVRAYLEERPYEELS